MIGYRAILKVNLSLDNLDSVLKMMMTSIHPDRLLMNDDDKLTRCVVVDVVVDDLPPGFTHVQLRVLGRGVDRRIDHSACSLLHPGV